MKKNNDNSTNNGNIILKFPLKLYPLESYGRELQHMKDIARILPITLKTFT
ncbi:hypothetical protein H8356DRAFT_1428140 [Neocallimastix lanati (nom. inval.)]|nr:hypothetical protein H8356DRAFT_1428140 [Neocallimastix sp. JGI-2020a]